MSRVGQVAGTLAELSGASFDEIARALNQYDVRDILAVVAAGVGGGGGGLVNPITEQVSIEPTETTGRALQIVLPAGADPATSDLLNAYDSDGNFGVSISGFGGVTINADDDLLAGDPFAITSGPSFTDVFHVGRQGQLGFFGNAAAEQPTVPLTDPTVQDVIDALVTLGLVTQTDGP